MPSRVSFLIPVRLWDSWFSCSSCSSCFSCRGDRNDRDNRGSLREDFSGRGRCGALCKKSIKQNASAPGSAKVDSLPLSLFAAPHNGATMGIKGSPEMGKNKNWQSTFLDTLVARKHLNISNIGNVKGSRKSTKFSTPFLCTQKSLNFTMIKRPWQGAQNRKL